jgi:hypothetical protein
LRILPATTAKPRPALLPSSARPRRMRVASVALREIPAMLLMLKVIFSMVLDGGFLLFHAVAHRLDILEKTRRYRNQVL